MRVLAIGCVGLALVVSGCKKTADNSINYKSAINTYYSSRPACLFANGMKFPVQEKTKDNPATAPYDALVDQGMLTRTTDEKRKMLVFSEQVTNYDLSDKGRSLWTASPTQPGYGNFCYGTRTVKSIDSVTPASDQPGATTTVTYRTEIHSAPDWARAAETENAFPQIVPNVAGGQETVTLTNTPTGWRVTQGPSSN